MQFGISIFLKTAAPQETIRARLAAAVAEPLVAFSLKPVRISDWQARYKGKSFVGWLQDDHFKLSLLNNRTSGVRVFGSTVVMLGTIGDEGVHAVLRPPIFNLLFTACFAVIVAGVFVLSFYGPSNTPAVHWLLAAFFLLPLAVLGWTFLHEARAAEQALSAAIQAVDATGNP